VPGAFAAGVTLPGVGSGDLLVNLFKAESIIAFASGLGGLADWKCS